MEEKWEKRKIIGESREMEKIGMVHHCVKALICGQIKESHEKW